MFNKAKDPFDLVVGFTSIIGSAAALILLIPILYYRKWDTELWLLIGSLSLVILVLLSLCLKLIRKNETLYKDYCAAPNKITKLEEDINQLNSQIDSGINIQAKIAQTFHNFSHRYRDKIVKIHENLPKQNTGRKDLHGFLHNMVANIKEIFDILTKNDCAVSIKTHIQP